MKKAIIYARYSSDSQTEQSIEGQLRVCREYAQNNDILIVDTYIDRAMTGTNDMRPDFQRMLKDSAKRQWEVVLVYKLDRFSRDKYEMTIHKHTLKENGVKLVSAMENIPDSPEGIILESLLEGMNQYYSAELAQKINRGLKESWMKGQTTGGKFVFENTDEIKVRKLIVNAFVREVILYDDEIVITYTFTDNPEHLKRTKETTLKTENQIEQAEKSASSYIVSSSIFSHFPPRTSKNSVKPY